MVVICMVSRFIPAYAGNTERVNKKTGAKTVHPRVRGEHDIEAGGAIDLGGSSPRTRGTRNEIG